MSPASKSKSKLAARAVKEPPRVSPKSSLAPANIGNALASVYNPVSGTFHTLEQAPSPSLSIAQNNGRFRTINETEEHSGGSLGTAEYDSGSNNGSCSGESEDQKEKTATGTVPRAESIPGSDTDKCNKIRQKNGKKHQRQKERRAQDLHERCSGYLVSRKLDMLSQQLVAMGFSSDLATMVLILNKGRVEESIAWLFEGCEENKQHIATKLEGGANLKIDITDELAKIADLEVKFKCTKQEVERAVVACEGDLEKAEGSLMAQKQGVAASTKLEEFVDRRAPSGLDNNLMTCGQNPMVRSKVNGVASESIHQQRRDDRDLNYTNAAVTGTGLQEAANRNVQSVRRVEPKQEWARPQVTTPLEKRWPISNSSPSVSCSPASPLQVAVQPTKESSCMMVGDEVNAKVQGGALREPVIVMQRLQSINAKSSLPLASISFSAPQPASTGWHPNGAYSVEMMAGIHILPNLGMKGSSPLQFYPQYHHQPLVSSPVESGATGWGGSWVAMGAPSSSSLAVPSSLGLFTGRGSTRFPSGPSSPVDWSAGGLTVQCDYTCIDWSLDLTPLRPSVRASATNYWTHGAQGSWAEKLLDRP